MSEINPILRRNMRVQRSSVLTAEDIREAFGLPADAEILVTKVEDRFGQMEVRWVETAEIGDVPAKRGRGKGQQAEQKPPAPPPVENKGQEGSDSNNQAPAMPPAEDMP